MNSLIPTVPNSLPYPDFFIPPKGTLESDRTSEFTKTLPASIFLANWKAFSRSLVQIDEAKPYR